MPLKNEKCSHLASWTDLKEPVAHECEDCLKTGDTWVHLRTCQTCGATLCCDSSPNRHASRHAVATGHPVVISAEPGEKWVWCFVDQQIIGY